MTTDADQMASVWQTLRERYPLLEHVVVHSFGKEDAERFPLFFGLFLAALDDKVDAPCCLILPRRGQMARLATIMFGLSVFRREFNVLAQEYANQQFSEGQRVRVHPSNRVFTFGGFWPNQPDKFRLCTLNGTGSRTFPANDVLRLEPTNLVTPEGRLDTNILVPEPTPLDEILGIPIFGNLSLFKNRVLCLDEQIRFAEFTDEHCLHTEGSETVSKLTELLPFAWLRDSISDNVPKFDNWSTRYPRAEPLVGVTSSSERLAAFCCAVPKNSKVVVVNGLRAVSNLQAFDDIAASQRLVLFADQDDEERMRELEARGCRFWSLGEREFFSQTRLVDPVKNRGGVLGNVVHRARNLVHLQIQSILCESDELNCIALHLEELRADVEAEAEATPNGRLGRLAQRLWRMLNQAAAVIDIPSHVEHSCSVADLSALRSELDTSAFWLKPDTITKLRTVLDLLERLFGSSSQLGMSKGAALRGAIEAANYRIVQVAVLTRTENQARSTEHALRGSGIELPVLSLATIPEDASFDRLIVTSWPGADAFKRLIATLIAPDIVAVCYGFEARWLGQCQRRFLEKPALTMLTSEEKTALVAGGSGGATWPEQARPDPPGVQAPASPATFDVWNYEHRLKSVRKGKRDDAVEATVRAKYVSFVGESYALLTQWHKVPVATRLLETNQATQKSIPERTVDDLKAGDLLVFPEGGQRALIAQMADQLIGANAPEVRKHSRLWREALMSSALAPEQFLAQARSYGHSRHIATIRNWFYDEAQIGPGEREDLDLIGVVTESAELIDTADRVWDSIAFLRSNHLAAGSALRDAVLQQLRGALQAVEDNGSRIEVPNLGAAWVVEVESIASDYTSEPRNEADRLLWDNVQGR